MSDAGTLSKDRALVANALVMFPILVRISAAGLLAFIDFSAKAQDVELIL